MSRVRISDVSDIPTRYHQPPSDEVIVGNIRARLEQTDPVTPPRRTRYTPMDSNSPPKSFRSTRQRAVSHTEDYGLPPDAVRFLKDSPVKNEVAQDTMEALDSSPLRLRYLHPEPEEDTNNTN